MRWLIILAALTFSAMAQTHVVTQGGLGFTPNGPCTPKAGAWGFCVDDPTWTNVGMWTFYDPSGTKTTLQQLINGGGGGGTLVGKTITGTLTCQGVKNQSIGSGFKTTCTYQVTNVQ